MPQPDKPQLKMVWSAERLGQRPRLDLPDGYQLRQCQDKVLTHMEAIMDQVIPNQRASRDFRVKFPDDVLQESLAGQLWFGAEVCRFLG